MLKDTSVCTCVIHTGLSCGHQYVFERESKCVFQEGWSQKKQFAKIFQIFLFPCAYICVNNYDIVHVGCYAVE